MKSIRTKLLLVVCAIVMVATGSLSFLAHDIFNTVLTESVRDHLDSVMENVADNIRLSNAKEFAVLEAMATLDEIEDPSVSLELKCDILRGEAATNNHYINIAYYDLAGNSYTADGVAVNYATSDYVKEALAGRNYVSNPVYTDVTNSLIIMYSIPVKSKAGIVIGALAAILNGNAPSEIVASINIGESNSHPYVISRSTGVSVADADYQNVVNKRSVKDFDNPTLQIFLQQALEGADGVGVFKNDAGTEMAVLYKPVKDRTDWTVLCIVPRSDFFHGLDAMFRIMLILFIVFSLAAFILCGLVITIAIKPLKVLDSAIHEIASGNADLTKRITVKSTDEIGSVVKGFNTFTEKLQSIISEVKSSNIRLSTVGDDLHGITQDTSTSITQILANIDSIGAQITNQAASVEETAGAVNEIASNIASLERMIESQGAGVIEASAAVEQMIGNIGSVNQTVTLMAESFEDLLKNTQIGTAKQEDVSERIKQIENQSDMLQEANQAIANIASQTNLLAMNAAIEAAHAGEAGKGFSVVADEIRKLSETSTAQSRTIGDQLEKIKAAIENVVDASTESGAAFNSMSEKITATDELVRQIKGAMEEQQEGSKQIGEALHTMNDSTSEVRTASKEMAAGNQAILEEVKNLQDATMVMKDGIDEMKVGTTKISEAGVALTDVSNKVRDSIGQIGDQIDKFSV